MCPDCSRLHSENIYLQRCKQEADKLAAVLHIEISEDQKLSMLIKRALNDYEIANGQDTHVAKERKDIDATEGAA